MKRVMVTGASGFVGLQCLGPLVKAGYEVHGVHPSSDPPMHRDVVWHDVDLLQAATVDNLMRSVRPTHLLHHAWAVTPGEYWRSDANVDWLAASLGLVRSFVAAGGERVVVAGTCAEYALTGDPLVPGSTPLRSESLYGSAKVALHVVLAPYLREHEVSFGWGHIFNLFGEREHPDRLVPAIIRTLITGGMFECNRPNDIRDFLYVRDVASAFAALLDSSVQGDVNIASGQPLSIGCLATEIANLVGRPESIVLRGDEPAAPAVVGDVSRLHREVGWVPEYTRTQGLHMTIDWWRERTERGTG